MRITRLQPVQVFGRAWTEVAPTEQPFLPTSPEDDPARYILTPKKGWTPWTHLVERRETPGVYFLATIID